MRHIGLFEGIGGFSLAARWMGWETIAWCEWNEFGQKVLKHHFPKAKPHGDITKTDFTIYRGQCDIITGGFPCQDISIANVSNGGGKVSKGQGVVYGKNTPVLFGKLNPNTLSLRTAQCSLHEDLNKSFATFPEWGMMRNGEIFSLRNLDSTIAGKEFSELPTPSASDAIILLNKVESYQKYYKNNHQDKTLYQCHLNGLTPHQTLEKYRCMMGFPENWTEIQLKPTETQ